MLEKQPFRAYNLEKKGDFITIRLNVDERDMLEKVKRIIRQPKDSTAMKTMFIYGMQKILHDPSNAYILGLQFKNEQLSRISGNFAETPKSEDL